MSSSSKPFWKSKTIWANVLVILVIVLESIMANQGVITDIFTPEMSVFILAGINIVLRAITNQPITARTVSE